VNAARRARAVLHGVTPSNAGPVAGVEHEYVVRGFDAPVDFSKLVDDLDLGRRLDPGDVHAHLGAWGGVITADGKEAEIATPPVCVGLRFDAELEAWAARGRAELEIALGAFELEGYSTHISVEVPDRIVRRVARTFAARVAPAMMLMLDDATSPGLLVRPRRNRLEICGEFREGAALRAAITFAVAGVRACQFDRRTLPPAVKFRREPARERYGIYVDRSAFGVDLYAGGRDTRLRRRRGTINAQDVLAETWSSLRGQITGWVGDEALNLVDAVVAGSQPLPVEGTANVECPTPLLRVSPWARALEARTPLVVARWDTCVFRTDLGYLSVPRPWLEPYLDGIAA
jgi:hypothetical protein